MYGESLKSSLVAVAVPDRDVFENWCSTKGVPGKYDALCKNEEVNCLVITDMQEIGKKRGLLGFEVVGCDCLYCFYSLIKYLIFQFQEFICD